MDDIHTDTAVTLILTDIVGLNNVIESDEQQAWDILKSQRRIINPILEGYGGTMFIAAEYETMLMFSNPVRALECAVEIQKQIREHSDVHLRMGMHIEQIAPGQGKISESGVRVASEILAHAGPGTISLSEKAFRQIEPPKNAKPESLGKQMIRGLDAPEELFQINLGKILNEKRGKDVTLFKDIWARRVPHILGIYLGGSWAIIEFVSSLLVDRYQYSPWIITLALVALVSMIPSVLMVAYFHGRPGPDRWKTVEKVGIPLNILVASAVIYFLFG